jgi:prepilin-type N-terminal cleavage/methylation domain-containing protein
MKMKKTTIHHNNCGYTLIELCIVIVLITVLGSIMVPKFDQVMQKAYQSKARGNLGQLRSAMGLYYSDHEGTWPLSEYPEGDTFYTNDGLSLTSVLVPKYIDTIPTPKLLDRQGEFNGISGSFDNEANAMMQKDPPQDVFIVWGPADYTPLLNSPYAYDNRQGQIYYPNGNYDTGGNYFYMW